MKDTDTPITLETAAMLLLVRLQSYEWRIALKADGDLFVVVGDDPPGMSQRQAVEGIVLLSKEITMLLLENDSAQTIRH